MAANWPETATSWLKMVMNWLKMVMNSSESATNWLKMAANWLETATNRRKMATNWPETAANWSKMATNWPETAANWLKTAFAHKENIPHRSRSLGQAGRSPTRAGADQDLAVLLHLLPFGVRLVRLFDSEQTPGLEEPVA